MNYKRFKENPFFHFFIQNSNTIKFFFLSFIIFVLSFPYFDPVISPGLDASWQYAINTLFHSGAHFGKDVAFTYGPLGFLLYPLFIGNNFLIAVIFSSFLLFSFIALALHYGKIINENNLLFHSIIIFFICISFESQIQMLLPGTVILLLLLHSRTNKKYWLVLAIVSAITALLIKSTPGFLSILIFFSFLFLDYFFHRNFKKTVIVLLLFPVFYFIFWFIIYRNFTGSVDYVRALLEHAKGNSSAMSLYPDNNWFLLGGSLLVFLLTFFFLTERQSKIFFFSMLLASFAAWKYSYTREDQHVRMFYDYVIMFFGLLFLTMRQIRFRHIALSGLTLMLLGGSMYASQMYNMENVKDGIAGFKGVHNFFSTVIKYSRLEEISRKQSAINLESSILPERIRNKIGNHTVDTYPWELGYIPANNFKWANRPVFQAYAAYTKWLDRADAEFFSSGKSADYIIWHSIGKELSGIDSYYVLNHEPDAMYQLLNHYDIIEKDTSFMLLKKNEKENFELPVIIHSQECRWKQWIDVPYAEDGIVRAKNFLSKGFFRSLKTWAYKDEQFFIAYKFSDGSIKVNRFAPENAETALWINPRLTDISDTTAMQETSIVKQIAFFCSNYSLLDTNIHLDWELIKWKIKNEKKQNKFHTTFDYFHLSPVSDSNLVLFHSKNNFESSIEYWKADEKNLSADYSFGDKKSYRMGCGDEFSATFSFPSEKISSKNNFAVSMKASLWIRLPEKSKATLVISVEDSVHALFWKGKNAEAHSVFLEGWEYVSVQEKIPLIPHSKIKAYLINNYCPTDLSIYIDDFEVKLSELKAN